jgi:hypothetical protein
MQCNETECTPSFSRAFDVADVGEYYVFARSFEGPRQSHSLRP